MSHNYLTEAFKELKILDEDTFSFSEEGAKQLKSFMDGDVQDDLEVVIDPEAETEEDLQDSYEGKVILGCEVCHSLIYKDPDEVVLDQDSGLANVGEECPYCQTPDGYKIVGQVSAYNPEEVSEQDGDTNEEGALTEDLDKIPAPFSKYYKIATEQEVMDAIGADPEDLNPIDEFEGYNAHHIAWVLAKDKYLQSLMDNGIGFVELMTESGSEPFLGYTVAERLYSLDEEDVKSALESINESLTEARKRSPEDIWSTIYHRLTSDGVERKVGRTHQFTTGVGYDYNDVATDRDGNIVVYGENRDVLSAAKKIAEDARLPYRFGVDKYIRGPKKYYITIEVPITSEIAATDCIESVKPKNIRKTISESKKSRASKIKESFNKASVETDDQTVTIESTEDGGVNVQASPKQVASEGEIIEPVSDEVKASIESNSEGEDDFRDVEVDEFDEQDFDELGESYLKEVYDNVQSYKTTNGYIDGNKIKLEGVISFKSGKKAKTNFIFESSHVTKRGKLKLLGENVEISPKKKSFTLTGVVRDKKLIAESLTYNYRGRDAKSGQTRQLYGTVSKKAK